MTISLKSIFFFIACCLTLNYSFGQQKTLQDTIQLINPPYQQFYSKYLDAEGIPVRSAAVVKDRALIVAREKLDLMLKFIPNVRKNLILNGAELHIIGENQQTSDLPEFKQMKGVKYDDHGTVTDIDKRTRGMGLLYASCGEENLLKLPNDRYRGNDICIHEFSHTIDFIGSF